MINDELLQKADDVRADLRLATYAFTKASIAQAKAKQKYERTFGEALAQGELMGRNEDTRIGEFSLKYPDLVSAAEEAEIGLLRAREQLEIARIEDAYLSRLIVIRLEGAHGNTQEPDSPEGT